VRSTLPPATAPLANTAERAGIALNAAQRTGSKPLQVMDSVLDYLPFTGDRQAVLKGAQRQAWQRAVMREMGENSDEVTPAVMNAARERIGQQFNDIAARNVVGVGDDFVDALATAERRLTEFSPETTRSAIDKALNVAVRQRLLPYNPALHVELPRPGADAARPLTLDEIRRLLDATRSELNKDVAAIRSHP
jgi:integrase